MKDITTRIIKNDKVAEKTYLMTLEGDLTETKPGQFLMVQVQRSHEPFLRRPLAILSCRDRMIEILFTVRGKGTALLAEKRTGELVSFIGPLGNGFSDPAPGEHLLYIAGGAGLPPVLSMAEHLGRGVFIFGAKTEAEIPLHNRLQNLEGIQTLFCTEDGSLGTKALATEILSHVIKSLPTSTRIYACGPREMLRQTWNIAAHAEIPCEVSLEERMACGFGVCSGCVVETQQGNLRVCREGPVFEAQDIVWGSR
ncbi:MAG: dihydroorotate dehydrogenase electron transfer subunit [Desulfomonilia bacterium]|nr:dihydroorotate dehydrogenase electron transfer subunit [Desulfomonilia bacterium]